MQENRYDVENLRFELLENGRHTSFVYHNGELLREKGGSEKQISYHLGAGIDALQRGRELSYYHRDEQLSTAYITGGHGEIQNGYLYDAFGAEVETNEQLSNRIRYTGQQYDGLAEQYYLKARYYNPILGRFMQEDVYWGSGLNLYAYCKNSPIMYYDPSGFQEECTPTSRIGGDGNDNDDGNFLYRKMSEEEYNVTISSGKLQGQVRGSDNSKWVSESYDKVSEFHNDVVKDGTPEYIVGFKMTDDYMKYLEETAIPQAGSHGSSNVKYHYEGLELNGPLKNYGITPGELDFFNQNIVEMITRDRSIH